MPIGKEALAFLNKNMKSDLNTEQKSQIRDDICRLLWNSEIFNFDLNLPSNIRLLDLKIVSVKVVSGNNGSHWSWIIIKATH